MSRRPATALLVLALVIPTAAATPAAAASPCRVTDTGTGDRYPSLNAALADADPNLPLTLSFTGVCREAIFIAREERTTIIGRRTRTTGVPTLNAAGLSTSAITIHANTVVLRGFTVTGGAPPDHGGGLYIESTPVSLIDMTIRDNDAISGQGGGVFMTAAGGRVNPSVPDPVLTIGGETVIRDNEASDDGGGVHAGEGVAVRMTGRARIEGNSSLGSGGGIYIDNGSLTMIGAVSVVENFATEVGGGVGIFGIVDGGDLVTRKASGQRIPPTIQGNGASQAGGLFYLSDGVLNLADLVVAGNRADGAGAGIGILRSSDDTAVLRDVTVRDNRAASGNGTPTSGVGAGLEVQGGTKLRFVGGLISGNRTNGEGGGIHARSDAEITLVGTTIRGNRGAKGAGILAAGAKIQAEGTTAIVKNKATGDGGGIAVSGASGTVNLAAGSVRIAENTAANGAGIHAMSATVFVSAEATVEENEATNSGGGIWVQGGDLLMDGTLRANVAAGSGGGLYSTNTNVTITGGKVLANTAGLAGAGIRLSAVAGKAQSIANATIRGNVAGQDGGGIAHESGILTIEDTIIEKNVARAAGGIKVTGSGISGTRVGDRAAIRPEGGGMPFALRMTGGAIRLNQTSSQDGAGIGIVAGPVLLNGVAVTGNKSARDAGGIHLMGGELFLSGGLLGGATVNGNTAARRGGGLLAPQLTTFPCQGISGNAPTNVVLSGGVEFCP